MSTQVQTRRGTTAEHSTFTGAVGELTVDTTKDTVVVHDGATAGGRALLREDQSNLPTSAPTTGLYNNSGALALSTSGAEALRIDSGGNILVVDGNNLQIDEVRARDGDGLKLFDDGGAGIFVKDGGNVGIGTSNPSRKLDVQDESTTDEVARFYSNASKTVAVCSIWQDGSGASGAALKIRNDGSGNALEVHDGSDGNITFVIDSSSNVGIGTTSASANLHVVGDGISNAEFRLNDPASTGSTTSSIRFQRNGTDYGYLGGAAFSVTGGSVTDLALGVTSGKNIVFGVASSEKARLDSSGRLLVGTSSAVTGSNTQYGKLQVLGNTAGSTSDGRLVIGRGEAVTSSDIGIGQVCFTDNTAGEFARIVCHSDAASGNNDYPGRLMFSTTADGASSPTEAMRINNAGELLVGYTADNGAYKLQVNSQIFATSATIATSDGRYKENVATLDGCVDLVKALRPVSFDWKEQQDITRVDDDGNEVLIREGHNFPDGTQVGFIAQEVQEVLADKPWLGSVIKQNVRHAVTDNDGNELAPEEEFLGIAEGNLIAVLTSALQEAIGRVEQLEAAVTALQQS